MAKIFRHGITDPNPYSIARSAQRCHSAEVAAVASEATATSKSSYAAVRAVDSTQLLVATPLSTTLVIEARRNTVSRSLPMNAS